MAVDVAVVAAIAFVDAAVIVGGAISRVSP